MRPVLLFTLITLDGLVPLVPGEAVLLADVPGAARAGWIGLLGLGLLAAVATCAGDLLTFGLGRLVGTERWAWLRHPRVARVLGRAGSGLERNTAVFVLGARFLPAWRVAVSFTAGATGLAARRYVRYCVLGSILWAGYMLAIGSTVAALVGADPLLVAVLALVTVSILGRLGRWLRAALPRRPRAVTCAGGAAAPV